MRLLHLADLHPANAATMAGQTVIDPATGLNQSLTDLARALDYAYTVAVVDGCCDAVVIPGDVFDSARPHANEIRVILRAIMLMASKVPVVIVAGNHDISQSPSDATALESLKGLENVFIFERPDTYTLDTSAGPVALCLLPYPTRGRLLADQAAADLTPEAVTAAINDGLRALVRGFSAHVSSDMSRDVNGSQGHAHPRHVLLPRILLAHGSVDGARVGDQPRSLAHDILLPADAFEAFDYVALGHIHQAQAVGERAWYSGSLMRNSFGEEHERKGFLLVEVEAGKTPKVEVVPNPFARTYQTVRVADLKTLDLTPGTVYRVKDTVTPEEYAAATRLIASLPGAIQCDLEIAREDRARDAGMQAVMSADEAVLRVVTGHVAEAELPALMEKHRHLMAEVG